jgi:hypothetical protein
VIVVIGSTYLRGDGPDAVPDGLAGRLVLAAASAGAAVELIAKLGDDPAGDAVLIALARAGVGHVAVLRDPVHPTAQRPVIEEVIADPIEGGEAPATWTVEPGLAPDLDADDVGLALRYLTEFRVVVAVHPTAGITREVAAAAAWGNAHLLIVTRPGDPAPTAIPAGSVVLEATDDGVEDSSIGSRLGVYAAAVDRGAAPGDAFAALTAEGPA